MGLLRFFFILLWLLPVAPLCAATPLARQLAVLEDVTGTLDLAQVQAADRAGAFHPVRHGFTGGFSRSVFWFRLDVEAEPASGKEDVLWIEIQPPYLDDVQLYVPDPSGSGDYRRLQGGDLFPFDARAVRYRSPVFAVSVDAVLAGPSYLRLQTTSSSLFIVNVWWPDAFLQRLPLEYALLGAFYGLMGALLLVQVWQGFWRRDRLFLAFMLHLALIILFHLGVNGLASQYLLPQWPALGHYWTQYTCFLMYGVGAWFYRRILQIDHTTPWLQRYYLGVQYGSFALLPAPLLGWYVEAAQLALSLVFLMTLLGLFRSLQLWLRGNREAFLLAMAHCVSLLGALSLTLALLGVLPGDFWLVHGYQAASLASVLACSQVMVWRLRKMEHDWREEQLRAHLFEKLSQQEQKARQEQFSFIAMLSHEVKTPLAMIDGAVQSLQLLMGDADQQVVQRHQRIRRGVRRLNELLEKFLHHERLDAPDFKPQWQWLDVTAHCQELLAGLERPVVLHCPPDLRLQADPALLKMALHNLLDNAIKYSPPDTPVQLHVQQEAVSGQLLFQVDDRGTGVAEAEIPHLFERFFRARGHGHVAGSGLGLPIVRRIAELHGGDALAEPRAEGGMRFTLKIPQRQEEAV